MFDCKLRRPRIPCYKVYKVSFVNRWYISHRYFQEEHLQNRTKVLDQFKEYGVRVKQDKCKLMSASVKYLGHRIDPDGIHAMDSKLKVIHEAPTPYNSQECSFLRLLNYYASFIPYLSSLIHPLNRLLRHDTCWKWSKDCKVTQCSQSKTAFIQLIGTLWSYIIYYGWRCFSLWY